MNEPERKPTHAARQLYRFSWCSVKMEPCEMKKVPGGWLCDKCGQVDETRVWVGR